MNSKWLILSGEKDNANNYFFKIELKKHKIMKVNCNNKLKSWNKKETWNWLRLLKLIKNKSESRK